MSESAYPPKSPAPDTGPATEKSQQDSGRGILYLDDDEALVFVVQRMLQRRGIASSGYTVQEQALAALNAGPHLFGLMVIDYNMPGMSGLEVARMALTIRPDLPVVIMSGFIDDKLREQALAAGVRKFILKADSVEDICKELLRMVARKPPAS